MLAWATATFGGGGQTTRPFPPLSTFDDVTQQMTKVETLFDICSYIFKKRGPPFLTCEPVLRLY